MSGMLLLLLQALPAGTISNRQASTGMTPNRMAVLRLLLVVVSVDVLGRQAAAACARAQLDGAQDVSGHWQNRPLRLKRAMEVASSGRSGEVEGLQTQGGFPLTALTILSTWGAANSVVQPDRPGRALKG